VQPPDALASGVGGTLRAAWLSGFLAGPGQQGGLDFRQSTHFLGEFGPRGTRSCGM